MATLTLTVAASTDDAELNDAGYNDSNTTTVVGTPGAAATAANSGQGWRFTNVTIASGATINSARMDLMKSTTQWNTVDNRWTCANEDNAATFSAGSPPGSRAIVATIVGESNNVNHTDGTVYGFPVASGDRTTFGSAIANVIGRAGWASGNALAVINQSKQDGSQGTGFLRENYHSYDSATASSEPQLVIDYTAAAGGGVSRLALMGVG